MGQKPQYKTKPEPDALLALLDMSGVTPEECFYVGDSDVDVFTANNAGVKMAGVSWGFRGKRAYERRCAVCCRHSRRTF